MPYSINSYIVDAQQKVVSLDWVYTTADGSRGNNWKLQAPYGNTPLANVTEEIAIGWLVEQLPEGEEEALAACIAADAERAAYQAQCVPYTKTETGAFVAPAPEESKEELVTADIKPKRGKK